MYSRYPSSILFDNHSYPVFSMKSKKLDSLTSRLFHSGRLEIGKYQRKLSIAEIKLEKDRSEQFQILSMQWFDRVINSRGHRQGQIVFGRYWEDIIYPIICEIHRSNSEPFFMAWNDHAYALRTMMLSKLYVVGDQHIKQKVSQLLTESVSFLSKEQNYDALSNHGWDQAKALLIATKLIGGNTDLAINRFRDELTNAFSSEGVHVENSPHYHIHMMNNLVTTIEIFSEMDVDRKFIDEMSRIGKSTILYYGAITRENGTIPCIGDSHENPPKFNSITKNFIENNKERNNSQGYYSFPETGYCYWKDNWSGMSVHLSLKNSHLSRYHRHDDDLSCTLNIGGIDVFIDGGLYKYEEKDEKRMYLRSPFSHSTIVIPGSNPQRNLGYAINNSSQPDIKKFTAESAMWEGKIAKRTIQMLSSNHYEINDSVENKHEGFQILFQTLCDDIEILNGKVRLNYDRFSVYIDYSNDEKIVEANLRESIYSPQYGQLIDSTTIALTSFGNQLKYSILFTHKRR